MTLKTVLFSTRHLRFRFRQQTQSTFYSIFLCRTMATARQQPSWQQPHVHANTNIPPLKVYNSLTKTKVPFVPIDPNGRKVTWYVCGPTVYDDAHLGHARNYVTTDIIRRILRDYFKFDVHFVMNITDVDDKIILRGRQQYLFNKFVSSHPTIDATVLDVARSAFKAYLTKNLRLLDPELPSSQYQDEVEKKYATVLNGGPLPGNEKPGDEEAKVKMHIKTLSSAAKAIADAGTASQVSSETFYTGVQDVFLPYLDHLEGSTIDAEDHSIFTKLTSKYEQRFLQDLRDLNVPDPDELTRVTEYGPQIAEFVERIVENKFAYVTSDGSVYFDIKAFEEAGFPYARLEPWSKSDGKLVAEGEGALTSKTTEKRSPSDFALWKASKPGEPSWSSRWGKGRPGWHIECSAMASDRLGKTIDIHSGGIDLAFPHHDNELAQSEAYWNTHTHDQWINYFLHMGHLSIQGSKMSKSLKNFTTIREALERKDWTSRSLRIVFLLGYWNGGIEITDDLVQAGSAWEERVNNFFLNLKDLDILKKSSSGTDQSLGEALAHTQQLVREHLCDSFNTPASMTAISDIIAKFNSADRSTVNFEHVEQLAKWVTSMVNIFGLNGDAPPDPSEIGWAGADVPEEAKPYLYPLSALRDSLRTKALSQEGISPADIKKILENNETNPDTVPIASAEPYAKVLSNFRQTVSSSAEKSEEDIGKEILGLCDRVRDVDLFDLGIYLEDRENRPALVRPVSKELLQLREEKAAKLKQKQLEKEKREKEAREKAEKGRLSHLEMFRTNEYSAWDADGLPIRDAAGDEITKSRAKKLKKDWERQKKLHEAWLATNSA